MSDVNSMYFSKEMIDAGEHIKLINFLIENSYGKGNEYNDIHIIPVDCNAITVSWVQVPWDNSFGGRFDFIDEDEVVCTRLDLPNGEWIYTMDPAEDFKAWLEDHPEWTRDPVTGHWEEKYVIR